MKKVAIGMLCFIVITLTLILLIQLYFQPRNSSSFITGNANAGSITLFIEGNVVEIIIDSPLNITYNFNPGSNYTLNLNVSSDSDIATWRYKLYDIKHSAVINESAVFSPNTTFNAVRWNNSLTVYANSTRGESGSKTVVFYVEVPNTSPILGNLPLYIYACEGGFLSYAINASDTDEDNLVFSISPSGVFFIFPINFFGQTFAQSSISSGLLGKNRVGNYSRAITVVDGQAGHSDTKFTNISVIEINNAPSITPVGAQTVWNNGENTNYYKQIIVNDLESGGLASGNLSLNYSFGIGEHLFNINSTGIINFSAIGKNASVNNISLCVGDLGLQNVHPNISLCGQNGSSRTSCINFSLTITDENRRPSITSWNPVILSFSAEGEQNLEFNITKEDLDGTIPDSYWYVDGALIDSFFGSSADTFNYEFPCDVSGYKNITVEISDGLLNASLSWNLSLSSTTCFAPTAGGGGGGGGGGGEGLMLCSEKWSCPSWSTCQNLENSFKDNSIPELSYLTFKQDCSNKNLFDESCGFQIRECSDVIFCNTTITKPSVSQFCQYVKDPTCRDGILDCHDNDCEVLIDCGGPCQPCATCSDKVKNQAEQGIDCGGPCPFKCEGKENIPGGSTKKIIYWIIIISLFILLLIIIMYIVRIIRALKERHETEKLEWNKLFLNPFIKK